MTMFAKLRRDRILLPVVRAALVAAAADGGPQPRGEPLDDDHDVQGLRTSRYSSSSHSFNCVTSASASLDRTQRHYRAGLQIVGRRCELLGRRTFSKAQLVSLFF